MAARETGGAGRSLLLVGVVVAVLGCSVPVAKALDEQEANQAVAALQRGGVAANKESDRQNDKQWNVTVSQADVTYAVTLLAAEGTPAVKSTGLLESLGTSALIPSPRAEQVRLLAGTAGEIERSLRELSGVLSARVHLAAPAIELLHDAAEQPQTTASVLVRYREGLTPISIAEVQRLVAGAVSGLTPDHVSVVLKPVSVTSAKLGIERFGPLSVSKGSVGPLRVIFGTAVVINLLLGATILWLWRRVRRAQD
jgi:type III secretion protein J